jgi:hypothetical protein
LDWVWRDIRKFTGRRNTNLIHPRWNRISDCGFWKFNVGRQHVHVEADVFFSIVSHPFCASVDELPMEDQHLS